MSVNALKHLQMKEVDGVTVVEFVESGLMFEETLIKEIGAELHSLVADRGCTRILLDFSQVRYMSSSMLGELARLAREVSALHGQLKITGLGPVLLDTFRIGHFDALFAIYDDKPSALKAFR